MVQRECSSSPIADTRLDMWLTLSRNATLKLNQPGYIIGTEKIDVSQSMFGVSVGDPYYFTAHVNRLGYGGYCVRCERRPRGTGPTDVL
jgi:hypothetical protein